MSSGVSEQMKIPGNPAKNAEERSIPWSQQVDEASYENLASPIDDNSANNSNSMQFQYPPFNAKENHNSSCDSYKNRKSSNSYEKNKYGKSGFSNNPKRDELQSNSWGANNARRYTSDAPPGNFFRCNRQEDIYPPGKVDNRTNIAAVEKPSNNPPVTSAPKKTTWASIASQPAKLTLRTTHTTSSHKKKGPGMPPPPMVPGKHNLDVNTWDLPNNNPPLVPSPPPPPIDIAQVDVIPEFSGSFVSDQNYLESSIEKTNKTDTFKDESKTNFNNANFGRQRHSPNGHSRKNWSTQHPLYQNRQPQTNVIRRGDGSGSDQSRYAERKNIYPNTRHEQNNISHEFKDDNSSNSGNPLAVEEVSSESPQAVLDELRDKNNYNPLEIDLEKSAKARFFVIKSYSEDDIHRSIKYEIWCSTDHGNKRLDDAFKERYKEGGNILLFFSVNGSGHFCGMAQMMTAVDYNSTSSVWSQDKWKGKFKVKWIYVKDVPNTKLRHIRLENNDNKSVTNSRDTQEVPNAKGIEVLQILHSYKHSTSIFDDFYHYEKKQEEEVSSKKPLATDTNSSQTQSPIGRQYNRQSDDRDRDIRGGGQQRHFGTPNFRDRNISHRGGYNNYNDHRRFDGHRSGLSGGDYIQKDSREDSNLMHTNRENSELNNRHVSKFDYSRRDDRVMLKTNNRERDYSDDHNKGETRFRVGSRELYKDNEHVASDRHRDTDY